jgi:hypothetical protein
MRVGIGNFLNDLGVSNILDKKSWFGYMLTSGWPPVLFHCYSG